MAAARATSSAAVKAAQSMTSKAVTLRHMLAFSADRPEFRRRSADFLRAECAGRFARRLRDLERLPFGLASQEQIGTLCGRFRDAHDRFVALPEVGDSDTHAAAVGDAVRVTLAELWDSSHVLGGALAALGRESDELEMLEQVLLQEALDKFHTKLFSLRLLMAHHTALGDGSPLGVFDGACVPSALASEAGVVSARVLAQHVEAVPEVEVEAVGGADAATFRHVPDILRFVLVELLKNAMLATARAHPTAPPPVQVAVAVNEATRRVGIRISDRGGGLSRIESVLAWNYLWSRPGDMLPGLTEGVDAGVVDCFFTPVYSAPVCGVGFGLPLSRVFAKYFAGDIQLHSMEGHGTDVLLSLPQVNPTDAALPM